MRKLPIGRAWEAMREDEIACKAMGINARNVKLSAFAIGAMLGGFAGVFFAARQGFISPESFTFNESAIILAIVVLGGMGSQLGVVLASLVLVLLPELGRDFAEYRMLLFGAAMILIMIWKPGGILSHREPTLRYRRRRRTPMSAPPPLLSVERLTMRFGGLLAIDDLSLDVAARQITGVIGPNGAGKTTFFNCLTGFYKPTDRQRPPQPPAARRDAPRSNWPAIRWRARRRWCAPSRTSACFRKMTVLENLIVAQHNALQHASRFSLAGLFGLPGYRRAEAAAMDKASAGSSAWA
jgi:hypothetical protein